MNRLVVLIALISAANAVSYGASNTMPAAAPKGAIITTNAAQADVSVNANQQGGISFNLPLKAGPAPSATANKGLVSGQAPSVQNKAPKRKIDEFVGKPVHDLNKSPVTNATANGTSASSSGAEATISLSTSSLSNGGKRVQSSQAEISSSSSRSGQSSSGQKLNKESHLGEIPIPVKSSLFSPREKLSNAVSQMSTPSASSADKNVVKDALDEYKTVNGIKNILAATNKTAPAGTHGKRANSTTVNANTATRFSDAVPEKGNVVTVTVNTTAAQAAQTPVSVTVGLPSGNATAAPSMLNSLMSIASMINKNGNRANSTGSIRGRVPSSAYPNNGSVPNQVPTMAPSNVTVSVFNWSTPNSTAPVSNSLFGSNSPVSNGSQSGATPSAAAASSSGSKWQPANSPSTGNQSSSPTTTKSPSNSISPNGLSTPSAAQAIPTTNVTKQSLPGTTTLATPAATTPVTSGATTSTTPGATTPAAPNASTITGTSPQTTALALNSTNSSAPLTPSVSNGSHFSGDMISSLVDQYIATATRANTQVSLLEIATLEQIASYIGKNERLGSSSYCNNIVMPFESKHVPVHDNNDGFVILFFQTSAASNVNLKTNELAHVDQRNVSMDKTTEGRGIIPNPMLKETTIAPKAIDTGSQQSTPYSRSTRKTSDVLMGVSIPGPHTNVPNKFRAPKSFYA